MVVDINTIKVAKHDMNDSTASKTAIPPTPPEEVQWSSEEGGATLSPNFFQHFLMKDVKYNVERNLP